ncbi:FG-GAP-like repeat-containing protein [Winogradskyella ouciana]|uniref:FG-GAP-like repeat-containing protein n=1 Tax=Winogradskyella ouciana TaxID=2608631 RepID=UPI003D2D3E33
MKRTLLTLISIFCVLFTVNSQTVWDPIQNIDPSTGADAYVIASGDLDGDSDIDIAMGTYNFSADVVKWYQNDGSGNFTIMPTVSDAGTLFGIGGMVIADLDGVNGNDIVASSYSNDTVMFYANNGAGGFATGVAISTTADGAGQVTAVDINNDGNLDISVAEYDGATTSWFPGNGDGTFGAKQTIANVTLPGNLSFDDFDNDGDLDAIVGYIDGTTDGTIEIYYNQYIESGTMTVSWIKDTVTVDSGNPFLFVAAFADVNDDGILDIVKSDNTSGEVAWYSKVKNGPSIETMISDETIIDRPAVVAVADFDNDTYNDVVVTDGGSADDALIWFESTDFGGLNTEALIADHNYQVFGITIADFDGDGDKDIASVGFFSETVDWYENRLETLSDNDFVTSQLSIFPNPTKDVLNFEGFNESIIDITITDILGKNIMTTAHNSNETLDVSELADGIYNISINGKFASKFIKK